MVFTIHVTATAISTRKTTNVLLARTKVATKCSQLESTILQTCEAKGKRKLLKNIRKTLSNLASEHSRKENELHQEMSNNLLVHYSHRKEVSVLLSGQNWKMSERSVAFQNLELLRKAIWKYGSNELSSNKRKCTGCLQWPALLSNFVMFPLYMGHFVAMVRVSNVNPHRDQAKVMAMLEEHREIINMKSNP